jgi:uncharacterized protein YcbK (DUF882 family)
LISTERHIDGRTWNTTVWQRWLAGLFVAVGFMAFAMPSASAETRTLKLLFIHTKEKAEITFKRNGRYDAEGLKKINRFLRDWRRNEPTKMDPRLLDAVWEAYRSVGARDYIHVVSAYRSPATNSMLRSRSKGVAEKSQHMLGKAMDFYIPGVPLKKLRDAGLKAQVGGVGYYPRSGSPFVHMDVGNVRHWPRMSRKELVAVFPNGKTLHVPSDGKPLPGYEQALASYQQRKKSGTTAIALASTGSSSRSGNLLSALFGGGADDEEDSAEESAPAKKAVASKAAGKSGIKIVSPDEANRVDLPVQEIPDEPVADTPEAIIAALPERSIPLPGFAPRPQAEVGPELPDSVPFGMAQAVPGEEIGEGDRVAVGIPVPAWRPDRDAPAVLGVQDEVMVAIASTGSEVGYGMPLPEARPEESFELASVEKPARVNALAMAAPKKAALKASVDGVKTTRKSSRATAQDTKPAPKPQVVAAQPDDARWALWSGKFSVASGDASVAQEIVRAAPKEVYATGFKQGVTVADANRFTGKAVSFMSVARFN